MKALTKSSKKADTLTPRGWLMSRLDRAGVLYEIIAHKRDSSARETAVDTNTGRLEFAKSVVVKVGVRNALLILPAHHRVELARVAYAFGVAEAQLVAEKQLAALFPDCEIGAQPPFGDHYHMPVVVAAAMALDEWITFNACSHECAVRMRYEDFERMVHPRVVNFSVRE